MKIILWEIIKCYFLLLSEINEALQKLTGINFLPQILLSHSLCICTWKKIFFLNLNKFVHLLQQVKESNNHNRCQT